MKVDYSIPWHLLAEDDVEFFAAAEVERGASFVSFHRKLSRRELAEACTHLWNFRALVPDPEESHINFAIGDAFKEFSNRFGTKAGAHFRKQFVRLSAIRDRTLGITGGALIYGGGAGLVYFARFR